MADPKKQNDINGMIADAMSQMADDAKRAFTGDYIKDRTKYATDGTKELTNALARGEQSVQTKLIRVARRLQSIGLEVDIKYDKSTNTVTLQAYNADDLKQGILKQEDIPSFNITLEKQGVAGDKINKYMAYETDSGDMGLYTLMEGQLDVYDKMLERSIERQKTTASSSARDIQGLMSYAQKSTIQLSSHASAETREDHLKSTQASTSQQSNAVKALDIYIGRYIDTLISEHHLYNEAKRHDVSGMVYDVFEIITSAVSPEEMEALLRQVESDPYYAPLTSSSGWSQIKHKLVRLRDVKGFKPVAGATNETARAHRVIGTSSARNISPGDQVMSDVVKQQGLNAVKQERNSYMKNSMATHMGEAMGVEYGSEGGWDSTVNTLNVTDAQIAKAWAEFITTPEGREYAKTHAMPSVRDGGLLIDKELAADLSSATRDYKRAITEEDYKKYYASALKKILKKRKLTEKNYENLEESKKKEIQEAVHQSIFMRLLSQDNRNTSGSYMTDDVQKDKDGHYIFSGVENLGYGPATRITDTYGNTRSASEQIPRLLMDIMLKQANVAEEKRGAYHAIKEQKTDLDLRNFGGQFKQDLAFVINNAQADGMTVDQIMDLLPDELKPYLDIENGKIYTDRVGQIKEGPGTDAEKQDKLKKIYLGLDKAKALVGGVRSYDDEGNLIGASVSSNNYSMMNTYDYGYYGSAVAMGSGRDSLTRAVAISSASHGGLTDEDAKKISVHFDERLGPKAGKVKALDRLKEQEKRARDASLKSADKGYEVDETRTVSVGFGDKYDVDLNDTSIADAIYDTVTGEILNYDETIWGRIDQAKRKKVADSNGALKPEDVMAYIDGLDYSGSVTYDSGSYLVGGKKMFLPAYFGKDANGVTTGGDYARRAVGTMIGLMRHGEMEKANDAALTAVARMRDDLYYKEGTEYQKVYKEATDKSMYNKILASNTNEILSSEEDYQKADKWDRYKSDMASFGVRISAQDARSILKDMNDTQLDDLIDQLYGTVDKKRGTTTAEKIKGLKTSKKISNIIKALTYGTEENRAYVDSVENTDDIKGLRALLGRLPFMNGLDIKASNSMFIERGLKRGSMRVGAGLARAINADYDGDRVAAAIEGNLSPELKPIFDKMSLDYKKIAREMARREKIESETKVAYYDAKGDPKHGIGPSTVYATAADVYAGIIGKATKQDVGVLSNFSTSIRNALAQNKHDENALLQNPDSIRNQKMAASGMLTRALFESMEQDSISSKKVINRIIGKSAEANGKDVTQLTKDEQADLYFGSLKRLNTIIDNFRQGKVDFNNLIKSLQDMGVLGDDNTLMSGRVVEQVMETIKGFSHSDEVLSWLFGGNQQAIDEAKKNGTFSLGALTEAVGRSSDGNINKMLNEARIKKGRNDAAISAENNPAYVIGRPVDENLPAFQEGTAAWKEREKIIRGTADALKYESELEKKKAQIALAEATAIGKNAAAYRGLGAALADAAQGYENISDRATAMLGGIGRQTSGPYGHILGVVSSIRKEKDEITGERKYKESEWLNIARNPKETKEEYEARLAAVGLAPDQVMSMKERAKRFGYSTQKGFLKDREVLLGATKGTLSHAADEALGRAHLLKQQAEKDKVPTKIKDYESIQDLLDSADKDDAPQELKDIAKKYVDARAEFGEVVTILGYTEAQQKQMMGDAESRADKNFKRVQKMAKDMGGEITSVERSFAARDAQGAKVPGKTDVEISIPTGSKYKPGEKDVVIVDYKNQNGLLSDHDIVQQLAYRAFKIKQKQDLEATVGKLTGNERKQAILKWANQNQPTGGWKGETEAEQEAEKMAYAEDLLSTRKWMNRLISTDDKGMTRAFTIGDIPQDVMDRIIANDSLRGYEQILRGVTTVTALSGEEKSGASGKSGVDHEKPGKSEEVTEEQVLALIRYMETLTKIHALKLKIFEIEKKIQSAQERGNDAEVAGLTVQKSEFETLQQQLRDEKEGVDKGYTGKKRATLLKKLFGSAGFKRVQNQEAKWEIDDALYMGDEEKGVVGTYESTHALQEKIKYEKEIQSLLQKRLSLEEKIGTEKKTIATSAVGKEKDTLAQLIGMQEQEVALLDEEIQRLLDSGKYRKEKLELMTREYRQAQLTRRAQVAAKDHGSMSLFDKMKYDVQRSMQRVMDYGISMRLINSIPRGLNKIYQLTVQLDNAITSLRVVTGMNRQEAEATLITYQKLGKQLGATTQEVAESATTWLRQGYAVEEAGDLIDASMKLSKLGFMQADQATQTLTAALKGFKLEVSSAMDVVDKFTQMDQVAAVSAQGVSEALSLMANSARLAGMSMDQAVAMVSTVGEVTQQSMSTVGNSMKTMLARFGNVKAGAFANMSEGGEETENINDIEKVLGALGISIRSASGEMREFDDVLADVAAKWATLDSVSKNAIAGALGG